MLPPNKTHESAALPHAIEEMLLQAAVGNPSRAAEELAAWKHASNYANYSDVNFAATRLLPLAYGNLVGLANSSAEPAGDSQELSSREPWLPQLAALHRYHWLRNAACQRDLLEIATALAEDGLDAVVLGGLSLVAAGCFDDLGERPLIERQILLSPGNANRAGEALRACGWRPPAALPPFAGWRRSEWWRRGEQDILCVCYQWLPKGYPPAPAERVIDRAITTSLGGAEIRIPDATDLLLLACVWNRRLTQDGSYRFVWAADALRVLQRATAAIDWDRLFQESRELKTLYPLRESLRYLRDTFDAPVQDSFLEAAFRVHLSGDECEPFQTSVGHQSTRLHHQLTRPYSDYYAAETVAKRVPSIGGLIRYWSWRVRCEVGRHRKAS